MRIFSFFRDFRPALNDSDVARHGRIGLVKNFISVRAQNGPITFFKIDQLVWAIPI